MVVGGGTAAEEEEGRGLGGSTVTEAGGVGMEMGSSPSRLITAGDETDKG